MTAIVTHEYGPVTLRHLRTLWSDGEAWRGTYREWLPSGGYLIHRLELSWTAVDVTTDLELPGARWR